VESLAVFSDFFCAALFGQGISLPFISALLRTAFVIITQPGKE